MRRSVALALGIVFLLASGCGVGAESSAQKLDPHAVPFGLLAPATTTTTEAAQSRIVIYLDGKQRLVPVARTVPDVPSVSAALKALGTAPTATESAGGLTSPLSNAAPLTLQSLRGGVASIDVPSSFEALAGQDQIVAAAQLVFTLTGLPGVTGVVLLVDGQPTQVPTSGGSLSEGPLGRADYAALSPT